MMHSLAFLSCENLDGYVIDDQLAINHLEEKGWKIDVVPWNKTTDWSKYTGVIIRTTWDYTQKLPEFLARLEDIKNQTRLINHWQTVHWNSKKNYLQDLSNLGLKIIPTIFEWPSHWPALFQLWGTQKIMVKPQIGANSNGTHVITRDNIPSGPLFSEEPLIQPFRENILSEGEWSFHFFYGEFSHAIRKVPKQSDYRVQEEHGGTILPAKPSFIDLNLARTIYDTVEAHLAEPTLFHRVDLVRNPWGHLEIMEIELIEPSLYFRTDPNSVTNFVTALEKFLSI